MLLGDITKRLILFRYLRNWEKDHTPKNLACSISIEANELLELFQWDDKCKDLTNLKEEIADIFIYLLYLCHDMDINIEETIKAKISINEIKYGIPNK